MAVVPARQRADRRSRIRRGGGRGGHGKPACRRSTRYDVPGALGASTLGLVSLVYGFTKAEE